MSIGARNASGSFLLALIIATSNACGAEAATTRQGPSVVAERNLTLGIILGAILFGNAAANGRAGTGDDYRRDHDPAPEPDPTRRISEQDCSKPIELDGGNLRCK